MNTVCMGLSGVTNAQQKTALKNALDKIEGIQSVDIDKTLGQITVGFNAPADEAQIKACISESGFRLS